MYNDFPTFLNFINHIFYLSATYDDYLIWK